MTIFHWTALALEEGGKDNGIKLSIATQPRNNQVAEAIHCAVKYSTILLFLF